MLRAAMTFDGASRALRALLWSDAAPAERDDDASLHARGLAGDRGALHLVYVRHAPSVRRLLGALLRDRDLTDDAVQETFLRAFARLDSVRDPARLRSYLLGCARMIWLEDCASRGRRERLACQPPDEVPVDTPEQGLAATQLARDFEEALQALQPDRRMALLLRVDQGLDYPAIAEAMDWPLHTVKNELHRARLLLRERLRDHRPDDGQDRAP